MIYGALEAGGTKMVCATGDEKGEVTKQLNDYLRCEPLKHMDDYIVPASLNDDQGILGCIRLALEAEGKEKNA